MRFSWQIGLYLLAALAAVFLVRLARRKSYFGYSLLAYLREQTGPSSLGIYVPKLFEVVGLTALCLALLNPVIPFADHSVKREGLNLALVVDLSSSMQMPVTGGRKRPNGQPETRMDAVKRTVIDFIRHRKGDRIGAIVFSNNAYVVSPMTLDYDYLVNYVELINEKTLSDEGMTSIGEGLLVARDLILRQEVEGDKRGNVIVLLTDGENNTGRPVDYALTEVKKAGIKIYFVGVEVTMGTTVQNQGFNEAQSLTAGVRSTGGKYFDARDATQLGNAYDEINVLEKGRFLTRTQLRDVPAFAPFAWTALAALTAGFLLGSLPRFRELS